MSENDRFWSKVDKSGGPDACWPWRGSIGCNGYGRGRRGGTYKAAHRLAWELTHGPIPEGDGYHGTCVCHRCDNPPCVNPAHLFLGTNDDNMADMVAKGRGPRGARNGTHTRPESVRRGQSNHRAKLTEQQVKDLRSARRAGSTFRDIAVRFGVSETVARRVAYGQSWRHVPLREHGDAARGAS